MNRQKIKIPRTVYRRAQRQTEFELMCNVDLRNSAEQSVIIDREDSVETSNIQNNSLNTNINRNALDNDNSYQMHSDNEYGENCSYLLNYDSEDNNNRSVVEVPIDVQDNASFQSELVRWAIDHRIPHNALNELLKIIRDHTDISLPSDARTLLHTPRQVKQQLKIVEPGLYYHFGFENCIRRLIERSTNKNLETIEICINIDGLPLSNSSSSQFYPILCCMFQNKNVEIIGLYHGKEKPKDVNNYLQYFIDEAIVLSKNGVAYNNKIYSVKIKAFICDAPAKSFLTCTRGHAGYNSCTKCYCSGKYVDNRVCFPNVSDLQLRGHTEFINKHDDEYHTGTSIIEQIPGIDIVNDIPLDYMHLICLGVVRKLFYFWCFGKPPTKLSARQLDLISNTLIALQSFIPCDFARKPRSLIEIKRYKATEYRQLLFYTGPIVLKSVLSHDMYINFLTLHVACTILSSQKLINKFRDYARSLMTYFVETFKILYGVQHISHNVHNLLHICNDTERFGVLDNFSAFAFENYLQICKKLLRSGDRPLEQVVSRLTEKNCCQESLSEQAKSETCILKGERNNSFLTSNCHGKHYQNLTIRNMHFKLTESDNCCILKNGNIVCIKDIYKESNKVFIIGNKFHLLEDLYTEPCASSTFGIFCGNIVVSTEMWNVDDIDFKYVKLKYRDNWALFPLLHT